MTDTPKTAEEVTDDICMAAGVDLYRDAYVGTAVSEIVRRAMAQAAREAADKSKALLRLKNEDELAQWQGGEMGHWLAKRYPTPPPAGAQGEEGGDGGD
jgi:hypothetical protein